MKSGRLPVTQAQLAALIRDLSMLVEIVSELSYRVEIFTGTVSRMDSRVDELSAMPTPRSVIIDGINDLSKRMDRFERSVRWVTDQEVSGAIYEVPWPPKAKPKRKARPRRK